MLDSLEKKKRILVDIVAANAKQAKALKEDDDEGAFMKCVEQKQRLIDELTRLDIGFQSSFDRVKEELSNNKDKYHDAILKLKELITEITALSAQIEAGEKRNRNLATTVFSNKRKASAAVKRSVKAASDYYKVMSKIDPQTDKRFNQSK